MPTPEPSAGSAGNATKPSTGSAKGAKTGSFEG